MRTIENHFTGIARRDGHLQAYCREHGRIGLRQLNDYRGVNAVVTEARAHDDVAHGVYRTDEAYRSLLVNPADRHE